MDDEQNPNDEELRDALEAAAVLDDDAVARVEVATQVAEAAEAAEEQAVADGDFAAAERIDQEADEVITELIEEAVVEAETAEEVVETVLGPPADEVTTPDDVATPDEELVVVPEAAPEAPPEPADAGSGDPFRGPGDWYVVHTYAGYENKVKANLESRIHTMQMEDKIFRVHIPMEDVMEIKSGKKQVVQKKVFPGYLLVKMLYDNDSWYVVRNTPGVTGFVSAGTGSKPTPLSKREVEKILVVKKEEQKPQVRLGFEEGDVVRIISGPFADFNGTISEINPDQAKLKVLVNIFDRETPVELSFDQVAKV
ncbi:MAG TPA: transcription termination/antitermination protein NusG [Actinomycetota bacterium]